MTQRDWDVLADLIDKLIAEPGTWQDKHVQLVDAMEERGSLGNLEEIASWLES